MNQIVFRYTFAKDAPLEVVESSILLAAMACESLHGRIDALLDAGYWLDEVKRVCVLDGSTPIGRDFNRMFAGFLNREFAADEYLVERVETGVSEQAA